MTCVVVKVKGWGRRPSFLCTPDGPLVVPDPDCSNAANHTAHPTGYIAASMWADEMMDAGWTQDAPCPGECGKWNVWTPPAG